MPILQERDQDAVRTEFQRIQGPVKLVVFSQELVAGDLCRENEQLMREVAALDERITVEVLNPAIDRERAEAYRVDQVPATVVEGARDYGLRFFGIPSGYEPALSEATKTSLAGLTGNVDIKVFSTPT
jgi:hypothetical protein